MKNAGEIALGVITSIGGFLEVGSIATSVQGGSEFGFKLAWAVVLGGISLAILMEMSGRLAAISRRTLADLFRECFGIRFFLLVMLVTFAVSLMVLSAEIGGVAIALQMATGVRFEVWALPIAFVGWLVLWRGTFGTIEKGAATLGLISVVFAVAAFALHPRWTSVAAGLVPTAPHENGARYWFLALSILGASISPYLYFFYSSGAVEDGWTSEHLGVNRLTASLGNTFGAGLSLMALVVAAMVFLPRGIHFERYEQAGMLLTPALGHPGFVYLVAALAITCFGTTLEVTLSLAYLLAQGLGWNWSENLRPAEDARFSLAYTVIILLAALPIVAGTDPLVLTNISMVATAASLPVSVIPMLVLMNDRNVMQHKQSGFAGNAALVVLATMAVVLFLAAVPLQIKGGG